jgi:hypothetical protein
MDLPNMINTIPVMDTAAIDINNDGFEDLVAIGNIYNTEVETPRLDNPYGLVLISNGQNNYKVVGPETSGLYIKGNAKSIESINNSDRNLIIVGCNNGPAEVFELKNPK